MPRPPGNSRGPKWKGPPGLTPQEKHAWSERERWRKKTTPQKWHARAARDLHEEKQRATEDTPATKAQLHALMRLELHVIRRRDLTAPTLTYIDHRGHCHVDDYRSAEQLIRDWKKQHPKQ